MNVMDAIRNRRAVREYSNAPIARSTVESLLEAAVLAPSAMNMQPWSFAVSLNPHQIDRWAEQAKLWLMDHLPPMKMEAAARAILEQPGYSVFYHAPALVLILAKSADTQAAEDCCLAAQNLMLAARDQGIGSCWIGFARPWLDLPSTKRELNLPENYHVVAPIILGVPKEWPETHGRTPAEIRWLG